MLREPEFLVIKELGVEPEALVSEPEALRRVIGGSQRLWCRSQRLWYSCDYCVTPVPIGLEFGFGTALGLGLRGLRTRALQKVKTRWNFPCRAEK